MDPRVIEQIINRIEDIESVNGPRVHPQQESIDSLTSIIDDLKDKLSDLEYKQIMDNLMTINNNKNGNTRIIIETTRDIKFKLGFVVFLVVNFSLITCSFLALNYIDIHSTVRCLTFVTFVVQLYNLHYNQYQLN